MHHISLCIIGVNCVSCLLVLSTTGCVNCTNCTAGTASMDQLECHPCGNGESGSILHNPNTSFMIFTTGSYSDEERQSQCKECQAGSICKYVDNRFIQLTVYKLYRYSIALQAVLSASNVLREQHHMTGRTVTSVRLVSL